MPTNDPALAADLLHTRLDLHRWSPRRPGRSPAPFIARCPALPAGCPAATSLVPVDDAPTAQVIGAQLDDHPVVGEDPDVVHPHLPADVSQYLVPVVQLH